MIVRYPHKAQLSVPNALSVMADDDGLVGVTESNITTYQISGRYEHKSGLDKGYVAKFYMEKSQSVLELFRMDGSLFHYEGRQWEVVRIVPCQTYIVIWLN